MAETIRGSEIKVGDRISVWFMSKNGAEVLAIKPYVGTLDHLWPEGARIVLFRSNTPSGSTPMTVPGNSTYTRLGTSGDARAEFMESA